MFGDAELAPGLRAPVPLPARFLLFAMGSLAVVALLAPRGLPLLTGSFYDRSLLAFVHLNTLGIIAAAIVGASYQAIPCALGVPLNPGRSGPISFWLYVSGLLLFLLGFFQSWHPVLATGALLLVTGLTLYIVIVARALRRARASNVVAWHIGVSLVGLSGGLLLGFLLAGSRGTWFLGGKTMQVLAAHALLMLAGWVAVMLNGVAYHMVQEFTASRRQPWRWAAWADLVLVSGGAWLAATALLFTLGRIWVTAGALAIAAGELLFVAQLVRLYAGRRHWNFDVHMPFALLAGGAGLLASALLAGGLLADEPVGSRFWVAAGWLAIGGMALSLIQGFFHTIAAEVSGTAPRSDRLWTRVIPLIGWTGWTAGLVLATWAVFAGDAGLSRAAGIAASAGLVCFVLTVARTALRWKFAPFARFRGALRLTGSGR
jgi:hypothetical protein